MSLADLRVSYLWYALAVWLLVVAEWLSRGNVRQPGGKILRRTFRITSGRPHVVHITPWGRA